MLNLNAYLQSICDTYSESLRCYTITDVVGKQRDELERRSAMLPLSPFFDFGLMVEKVKQQQEEKTERLTVIEGLRKYACNHVLLIGRPGSGKSTALLRLLLETSPQTPLLRGEGLNSPHSLADSGENEQIPILVELRFYKTSIIELIRDFLKRHQLRLEINEIEELLFAGKFLLLIDGVNELPSEAARQDLQKFRQDYQQTTPMIFTTRDLGVGGDLGIDKKLQMQPLTEEQMRNFVCGYLSEQGEEMLKQLEGRLRELGETPLLLMMLCSVFASNQNKVPANLGLVFRRFTEIYDNKFKQDIPVTDESRRWWKRLLQHLAWVMTHGRTSPHERRAFSRRVTPLLQGEGLNSPHSLVGKGAGGLGFLKTEILVAIPIQEARDILTKFLKEQDYHQPRDAEKWLDDLLKYHLIQIGAENQIEFRHQLLQEYYAAERLLEELPKLSDDDLQWEYLNYLKWTETVALMMQLVDKQYSAVGLVKLGLEIDWQLGARLAGEVTEEWQGETVGLIDGLEIPALLKIRLLGRTKSEAAIIGLILLREHEDSSVRDSIASALVEIKFKIVIPKLISLREYEDSSVRCSAEYALGEIKSETAIPGLISLLEDEDSKVRSSAASALGEIKSETVIPGLISLLADEDSSVRFSAAYALGKIKSEAVISGLISLLEDEDSKVRSSAASALGEIKSEAAISGLISLLEDEDSSVRFSTAYALGKIKSEAAIPGLISLLEDEDSKVRSSAASALGKIKSEAAIPGLISLLEDEDSSVRSTAVDALGEIKSEAAIPGLISLLKDEDSDVRYGAASALGEIKSEAAIPGLIQLLKTDKFVKANNGDSVSRAIHALEEIQEHLKYYKPIPKPTMSNTSHNYALLIGVGECEETKLSLPVTVKDIQALKTLLTDSNLCGYIDNNIRLLYNETATKQQILENLTWLKQQAENDPEATILIYYSGHGCLDNSGNYYLIPHETDRADIPDTALSAETINQALQEIPAQRLLVIIDSCHAQGMATSKDAKSPIPKGFTQTALPKTIIDNLKGTGRVVFTSSTGTQLSWIRSDRTMSIYTYHFLEALQGAGNQPGDKTVKVSHLMNYLSKTVPSTTQQEYQIEQTPFFDFATEDFPVALLLGGKGLPEAGYESVKAEENIRSISNQVKDGVGIVGDGNIGFNIGTAGNITFGDISSK